MVDFSDDVNPNQQAPARLVDPVAGTDFGRALTPAEMQTLEQIKAIELQAFGKPFQHIARPSSALDAAFKAGSRTAQHATAENYELGWRDGWNAARQKDEAREAGRRDERGNPKPSFAERNFANVCTQLGDALEMAVPAAWLTFCATFGPTVPVNSQGVAPKPAHGIGRQHRGGLGAGYAR